MVPVDNEFKTGWTILVASFLGVALGLSSLYFYSFGIFIKPLSAEFGWSRGEASLGILIGTICSAIMSMPTGRMVDKIGAVRVGLVSLVLLSLSFFGLGFLTVGLVSFLTCTAVLSLVTTGSTGVSFTRLVVSHFDRNRGIALGIVLSGAGVGAMLVPRLLTPYVSENGWRSGYIALGVSILVFLPLIWFLLRSTKEKLATFDEERVPFTDIILTPAFVSIGVIFLFASIGIIGTVVHFVPMLTDQGLAPQQAGQIASLIGLAAICGRLVAGAMLDRFSGPLVTSFLFLIAASGLILICYVDTELVWIGALITGLAIGAEVDLMAYLTSRFFSGKMFGQAYGALYSVFLIGGAIGPSLYGFLFDAAGHYRLALFVGAGFLMFASFGALLLYRFGSRFTEDVA